MICQFNLKKSFLGVAVLITALINQGCASMGGMGGQKINVPSYSEETFANGMRFVHVRDSKLPIVSFSLMVAPGASADPVGRSGLMYVTTEMLEKGTAQKNADQVADAFAAYGTSFSTSTTHDYMVMSTESLSQNQIQVFELFKEVVLEPKFETNELEMMKKRLLASIKQKYDDPDSFADLAFSKQVMGAHAYARPVSGTERDVAALSRSDVTGHYAEYIRPANMTMIVTGDYSDELVAEVRKVFSGWSPAAVTATIAQATGKAPMDQKQLLLVDRDDLQQTQVRFGHLGVKRADPDYWAAQVANVILGGNFSSRLMKEVRIKRGLTYSVSSNFTAGVSEGPFEVSTFTRNDKVGETVQVTLDVLKEFRDRGVTQQEADSAKNYLKGHLIRNFEKPEDVVRAIARMRLYGLSKDDVTEVVERVNDVTLEDINRVAKTRFRPDQMRVLIYSSKGAVLPQLRSMGALDVRSYREFQ